MRILVFNHEQGGWYEVEIETMSEVYDILDDPHNRLPEDYEIDKRHRNGMYSMADLDDHFNGVRIFDMQPKRRLRRAING